MNILKIWFTGTLAENSTLIASEEWTENPLPGKAHDRLPQNSGLHWGVGSKGV